MLCNKICYIFVGTTKENFYMTILAKNNVVISISGSLTHVISSYLRVFLTNQRLTEKQLEVTTALILRYAEYTANGVIEPYSSTLLFSTDTRKDIVTTLKISPAHLNNTFNILTKKNIISKQDGKYSINPQLLPNKSLIFKFSVND